MALAARGLYGRRGKPCGQLEETACGFWPERAERPAGQLYRQAFQDKCTWGPPADRCCSAQMKLARNGLRRPIWAQG